MWDARGALYSKHDVLSMDTVNECEHPKHPHPTLDRVMLTITAKTRDREHSVFWVAEVGTRSGRTFLQESGTASSKVAKCKFDKLIEVTFVWKVCEEEGGGGELGMPLHTR